MKSSLIIAPALICCISFVALSETSISYITVSYAGDATRKVMPRLKQQPKAMQTQYSGMLNKDLNPL